MTKNISDILHRHILLSKEHEDEISLLLDEVSIIESEQIRIKEIKKKTKERIAFLEKRIESSLRTQHRLLLEDFINKEQACLGGNK